jgi:hypothetical protein
MDKQFDAIEWLLLTGAALSGSLIKILRGKDTLRPRYVAVEILIGLAVCVFVIPALSEYFHWTVRAACLATFASAYTSHLVLRAIEGLVPLAIEVIVKNKKGGEP